MKKIKKFIINGNNFKDVAGFYDEFEKVFLKNYPKDFKFGKNLDALDDILFLDEEEKEDELVIVWEGFDKSEKELPSEELVNILEILKNHEDIKLILKKKNEKQK